ncbi:MAG: glycosyltransferase family 2 protein, partial [Tetrasphaera sp.]|nr:glycosyltransferase family 2 protein [Tetrasphaera sp.]
RDSRLFKNIFHHMASRPRRSSVSFVMFKPYVVLTTLTVVFGLLAAFPLLRFFFIWLTGGDSSGNVQSSIFGAIMSVASLLSLALGVISDLQRTNRVLLEEQLERIKEMQYRR